MSNTERTPLLSNQPINQSFGDDSHQSINEPFDDSQNDWSNHFNQSTSQSISQSINRFLRSKWVIFLLIVTVAFSFFSVSCLSKNDDVIVSPYDKREYQSINLSNKMRVLLIHDQSMIDNAVSMSVKVGFYNDPDDVPGLAHFVEHELFAGSRKYPSEDLFKTTVLMNSGHMNAFTKEEETNFYFKVNHQSINQTLDIFAQFFIAPKFGLSRIAREMKAIDSEHQKRINVDDRRRYQILTQSVSPRSPLAHYSTGDVFTLNRTDIAIQLRSFHSHWYSANRMTLCIMGRQSIDQLIDLATSTFSAVPNKDTPDAVYEEFPMINQSNEKPRKKVTSRSLAHAVAQSTNQSINQPINQSVNQSVHESISLSFSKAKRYTGNIVYLEPVRDSHILTIYWQQSSEQPIYSVNPSKYVSFLLGHKGEAGLVHRLKRVGWGSFVSASVEANVTPFSLYHVRIGLTNEGVLHIDDVIDQLYDYIHTLRNGVHESYQDEIIAMENVRFLYPPHVDPAHEVNQITARMHKLQSQDWMLAPNNRKFDKRLIDRFFDNLRPIDSLVLLSSSMFTKDMFLDGKIEQHYQIPYVSYALPDVLIDRWTNIFENGHSHAHRKEPHLSLILPHPYQVIDMSIDQSINQSINQPFDLPPANPFIPRSFEIVSDENHDFPVIVSNNSVSRVWIRSINQELKARQSTNQSINQSMKPQSPLASIALEYRSPSLLRSLENQAISQLYVALVRESFMSLGASAQFSGYDWSIDSIPNAIRVRVSGLSSELLSVFHRLIDHVVHPLIDSGKFSYVRRLLFERRDNIWLSMQPYEQALYFARLITEQHKYSDTALMQAAQSINQSTLETFLPALFSGGYLEMFGYGNLDLSQIQSASEYVIKNMNIHEDQSINQTITEKNNQTNNQSINQSLQRRRVNHLPANRVYRLPPGRYLYQPPPIQRSMYSFNQSINLLNNQSINRNPNSATYVSIFTVSYHSLTLSSRLRLFHTLFSPFCSSRLRSQLMLGYVVKCFLTIHFNTVQSLDLIVQGNEYDAAYLDERMEEMVGDFESVLIALNETSFLAARHATIQSINHRPASFQSMFQSDWSHIVGLDHHFNRSAMESQHLQNITKQDIIDFYLRYIARNRERRRLSVEIFAHSHTRRLPTGGAAPTAIIEDKSTQETKMKWEVYELEEEKEQQIERYGQLKHVIESMWKRPKAIK